MQYFVKPGTQMDSMEKWKEVRWNWHKDNGIREEMMRWEPHPEDNATHYADAATDIEYLFPNGWVKWKSSFKDRLRPWSTPRIF